MPSNQLERTAGFLVSGRVQRVGFRWWTRRTASGLGLSGTVRNLADGAVEVRVRGSSEAIETFRQRLRAGPPGAAVMAVETFPVVESLPAGFHVLA